MNENFALMKECLMSVRLKISTKNGRAANFYRLDKIFEIF